MQRHRNSRQSPDVRTFSIMSRQLFHFISHVFLSCLAHRQIAQRTWSLSYQFSFTLRLIITASWQSNEKRDAVIVDFIAHFGSTFNYGIGTCRQSIRIIALIVNRALMDNGTCSIEHGSLDSRRSIKRRIVKRHHTFQIKSKCDDCSSPCHRELHNNRVFW